MHLSCLLCAFAAFHRQGVACLPSTTLTAITVIAHSFVASLTSIFRSQALRSRRQNFRCARQGHPTAAWFRFRPVSAPRRGRCRVEGFERLPFHAPDLACRMVEAGQQGRWRRPRRHERLAGALLRLRKEVGAGRRQVITVLIGFVNLRVIMISSRYSVSTSQVHVLMCTIAVATRATVRAAPAPASSCRLDFSDFELQSVARHRCRTLCRWRVTGTYLVVSSTTTFVVNIKVIKMSTKIYIIYYCAYS